MSGRQTRSVSPGAAGRSAQAADERAYGLLEEARLRCEQLTSAAVTPGERSSLAGIHKQLGMAGWIVSSEIVPIRRHVLLACAHHDSRRATPYAQATHALAELLINAEDTIASSLTGAAELERRHLVHVHLLHAMDLLHAHLHAATDA